MEPIDDHYAEAVNFSSPRYMTNKAFLRPLHLELNNQTSLSQCTTSSASFDFSKPSGAMLWRSALKKMRSIRLDPWHDFSASHAQPQTAIRHRYSAIKKKWVVDEIQVKVEPLPFDHGAMRECFRLKKLPQSGAHVGDWQFASNYVAKRYIAAVDKHVYFDDVRLQMEAKLWGEAFNRQNPPKKVDIFQLSVLEIKGSESATTADRSPTNSAPYGFYHIERFMEGEYRKYNSNSGFVDEQLRNTPQAFSHFTFERSGHRLLVVDIQGVGDLYTDPQIHTSDGVGYSDGNLGPRGMALFFHSHRCNPLCEWLGLAPFDLAPSELAAQLKLIAGNEQGQIHNEPSSKAPLGLEEAGAPTATQDAEEELTTPDVFLPNHHAPSNRPPKLGARRRTVSLNQQSTGSSPCKLFGPTVARSTENMSLALSRTSARYRSYSTSLSHASPAPFPVINPHLAHADSSDLHCANHHKQLYAQDPPLPSSVVSAMTQLLLETESSAPADFMPPFLSSDFVRGRGNPTNDSTQGIPRPLLSLDDSNSVAIPIDQHQTRPRAPSGDSGYSYRIGVLHPLQLSDDLPVHPQLSGHHRMHYSASPDGVPLSSNNGALVTGSTSSLLDFSAPTSPILPLTPWLTGSGFSLSGSVHSAGEESVSPFGFPPNAAFCWPGGQQNRLMTGRRQRNLSESSDLDVEEDHRLIGNTLHQLMHESHKPSCADHPTNLDQEIGQSILGQIHHELARLHEAGRFLPGRTGGWSHAGLGGLLLKDQNRQQLADDLNDLANLHGSSHQPNSGTENNDYEPLQSNCPESPSATGTTTPEIDWTAVLFHERHAAQLGCLEAMIVMAHYYLGLPSQLLSDCPIKANHSDVRLGVDYLWRAAEGGDRRCMILLARYLDMSAGLADPSHQANMMTTPADLLILPALCQSAGEAKQSLADNLPPNSADSWAEAVAWYKRAVDTAGACASSDGTVDEGLDAEGRYDAAEDLLPVYRLLARMAEMHAIGGYGLTADPNMAGDLFTQAGELASAARQGRLAVKYFELADELYASIE